MNSVDHDDRPTIRLDPHHARTRRALAEITGAVGALLHVIKAVGGWQAHPPEHADGLERAMNALAQAYVGALDVPGIGETHSDEGP